MDRLCRLDRACNQRDEAREAIHAWWMGLWEGTPVSERSRTASGAPALSKEVYVKHAVSAYRWVFNSGEFGEVVFKGASRDFDSLVAGSRDGLFTEAQP